MEFKEKLNIAFKAMRKAGLLAYQNWKCCGNCGGYAVAEKAAALPADKRALIKGTVFYHAQDAQDVRERATVYLAYGQIGTTQHGDIGLESTAVGELIVPLLTATGLVVEWDGTESRRIHVSLPPVVVPPTRTEMMAQFAGIDKEG